MFSQLQGYVGLLFRDIISGRRQTVVGRNGQIFVHFFRLQFTGSKKLTKCHEPEGWGKGGGEVKSNGICFCFFCNTKQNKIYCLPSPN